MKKYQHHHKQTQELSAVADVVVVSLPCRVQGKWYHRNHQAHGRRQQPRPWPQGTPHLCRYFICEKSTVLLYHLSTNKGFSEYLGLGPADTRRGQHVGMTMDSYQEVSHTIQTGQNLTWKSNMYKLHVLDKQKDITT